MPDHTIAENLTRLQNATTAIGNAITAKGGTVSSGDGLEDFASDIGTIPSGGGGSDLVDLIERDITSIDIPSSVTSIGNYAFLYSNSLRSIIVNKAEGSISGAPWGASRAVVTWTG